MMQQLLVVTDLDGTLLAPTVDEHQERALDLLRGLLDQPPMTLAYATGRDLELLERALDEGSLPRPHFAVTDVGSTIHVDRGGEFRRIDAWWEQLRRDWKGLDAGGVRDLISWPEELEEQPSAAQKPFKLSFFVPVSFETEGGVQRLQNEFAREGLWTSLVFSVETDTGRGLLDVLPGQGTKLGALRWLSEHLGVPPARCLFAGDSGNDLLALASEFPAVLVANADRQVRIRAQQQALRRGNAALLYEARGSLRGLDGRYAGGVVEGLAHFHGDVRRWVESSLGSGSDDGGSEGRG